MQIGHDGFFHLTYCTKVHPGSGWEELFGNLQALVPRLKARLAPERPFGLGLRLSNAESRELLAGDHLARFQDFLAQHDLYVFTLNGFPYGDPDGAAGEGGNLRPGLAGRPAPRLHPAPGGHPGPPVAGRRRGRHLHRASVLPGLDRRRMPRPWRRSPPTWCA